VVTQNVFFMTLPPDISFDLPAGRFLPRGIIFFMHPTTATFRTALALLVVLAVSAGAAEAKRYSADRFDTRIQVLPDGSLRVTETIVFHFESGTFREVFRELPTRRTDGIEVERVAMDGLALSEGMGPGQAQIRRGRRIRVTWRFAPTSDTIHTFDVTYLVRGAVRQADEADAVVWQILPTQHRYPIASSTTDVLLPAIPIAQPRLEWRRVGRADASVEGTRVRIHAEGIRSNGRLAVEIQLPPGSVLDAPPAWQARARLHAEGAPQWIAAGGVALTLALIAILAVRQRYDAPKVDPTVARTGPALPDSLGPAEAGALISNGSPRGEHAMAALYHLAERGEVTIIEEPRRPLGQRRYRLVRRPSRRPAAPYEEALLEAIFIDEGRPDEEVALDKARSRLFRGFKRFRMGLEEELRNQGLFDPDRHRVRHRFAVLGAILILGAGLLAPAIALLFAAAHGLWPLFIPLGLAIGGFIAILAQASHTPLSNEGLRRARYWRGFRDYLRDVASHETPPPPDSLDRLLPYAVALGLAGRWSKFLKDQRLEAPAWFHAASPGQAQPAFVAFVATTAASTSSGGGGMAAVGGGTSGAR
jgi:hypothetical protein